MNKMVKKGEMVSLATGLTRPSRDEAEAAVRTLIRWTGDDPDREGLLGTPDRVVRSYGRDGGDLWTRGRRAAYRMYLLPAVMDRPPVQLARLAPLVTEAAQNKDAVAEAILDTAADHLADTVEALEPRPGERLVVTGGLLGPEGPLTTPLTGRLRPLGLTVDRVTDGCAGAVILARLAHTAGL